MTAPRLPAVSEPAASGEGLPELPEAAYQEQAAYLSSEYLHYYTAEQMHAYAIEARNEGYRAGGKHSDDQWRSHCQKVADEINSVRELLAPHFRNVDPMPGDGMIGVSRSVTVYGYAADVVKQLVEARRLTTTGQGDVEIANATLRAAYRTLHQWTKEGTVGRQNIESFHRSIFPEEYPEPADYCPYCLGWKGGPMICCDDGYANKQKLPQLTKSEASQKRAAPFGQQQESTR